MTKPAIDNKSARQEPVQHGRFVNQNASRTVSMVYQVQKKAAAAKSDHVFKL